jgi:predicted component of type VI protein secretion system
VKPTPLNVEPFRAEALAHELVEIGTRLQAVALAIAWGVGHTTADELAETAERAGREAMTMLDRFRTEFAPRKRPPTWP